MANLTQAKVKSFRTIASSDQTAERVLGHLIARGVRGTGDELTDVRRLAGQVHIPISQVRRVFEQLQAQGLGSIIKSSNPKDPDRFKWGFSLKALSDAVKSDIPMAAPADNLGGTITVTYPIRGRIIHLNVPKSMSKEEADRLADFIRQFGV